MPDLAFVVAFACARTKIKHIFFGFDGKKITAKKSNNKGISAHVFGTQ